jgi:hypothetical protein
MCCHLLLHNAAEKCNQHLYLLVPCDATAAAAAVQAVPVHVGRSKCLISAATWCVADSGASSADLQQNAS